MVFAYFFRSRQIREGYVNLALADHELFDQGFDDPALVLGREFGPAGMEGMGLVEDVLGGELVDLEEVHIGLELGQFGGELVEARFGGLVEVAEALGGDLAFQIQAVGLIHLVPDFLDFPLVRGEQGGLFGEGLVGKLLMVDARSMRFETLDYAWDPGNPLSGEKPTITDLSIHQ